jgi:signal transduction histidine kinase
LAVIITAVFLAGYYTARQLNLLYLLFLLPVPASVYFIFRSFNQSNLQIAYFFEAIRNEDSSLKFPTMIRQKSLRILYQSLNGLNEQISEIKLRNEHLEKYYLSFIQHAATGLMAMNRDHEVEIMNDKAFEYAGIPSLTPLYLVPLRNPELFKVLREIKPGASYLYVRFTSDSQVNLMIRSREIRFGEKVSRLISLQDIRHELDEKELDSWQKLIRVLTHEIMNSIAPIVSLTGTLRRFFNENDKLGRPDIIDSETIVNVIQGLDTIEERGNGLLNFVNSYRKLTRIPEPEFSTFPIREWFDQIRLLLHEKLEYQHIRLDFSLDSRLKELTADKKLMTQVIINILNNAMEALEEMAEHRKIAVSIELSKQNRPLIKISNNGPAIPVETIEKIFVPFFTTKENGSGIGLSLSRQILRLHRGNIYSESTGKVTSFIITL